MTARLRSWWQKIIRRPLLVVGIIAAKLSSWREQIQKYRRAIGVVAIVLTVITVLIIAGYWLNWTGFNGYDKVTKEFTPGGQLVKTTSEYQPGKTLWDWLQLLFVPGVLTLGAIWFTARQNHDREIARDQYQNDRDIALDNHHEVALQAYIDKMSELLLAKNLRSSKPDDEVRNMATARTLTVLPNLDAPSNSPRKRTVIIFLHDTRLIAKGERIIDLKGADLSGVDLSGTDLSGADLSGADLSRANLRETNLRETNLRGTKLGAAHLVVAYLSGADLRETNLRETDLSGADLSGADLSRADLSGADLSGADLSGADLSGAVLSRVLLSGADLSGADLGGADLSGAVLSRATITLEQAKTAKSLQGTTLPDGLIPSK